ncbi:hypothetical protein ACSNOD_30080, partial [Streptomyces sp. URMC 123]
PPHGVPDFAPVRPPGGRHRLVHAARRRRGTVAAGLAMTAAALAAGAAGLPHTAKAGGAAGEADRAGDGCASAR